MGKAEEIREATGIGYKGSVSTEKREQGANKDADDTPLKALKRMKDLHLQRKEANAVPSKEYLWGISSAIEKAEEIREATGIPYKGSVSTQKKEQEANKDADDTPLKALKRMKDLHLQR